MDLLGGRCVRLYRGDYGSVTRYGEDPAETARAFRKAGARRIHVVDLDAARGGGADNRDRIREIRAAVDGTIEVGGGVRSESDVEELLAIGVDRLIVGTLLARDPDTLARWTGRYGRVFIAGIDALDGTVKISGWEAEAGIRDLDLAARAREVGAVAIIYTDISRDGTLEGPSIERTNRVAEAAGLPVILSGGIGSDSDVEAAVRENEGGIVGIITGKAVYEGKVDLARMIGRFQTADDGEKSW